MIRQNFTQLDLNTACRNKISAIQNGVAIKQEKWMGLETRNFIQVQALSMRSNTLLLSVDWFVECIIDRMIWEKSYALRGIRTPPYIGGEVRITRYSPYS